jgi:hypothetical protein
MIEAEFPEWLVSDSNPAPIPMDNYPYNDGRKRIFIYALIDPETGAIRYIGKTSQSMAARIAAHLQERGRCHRVNWLNSLKRRGLRPDHILLEVIDGHFPWQASEEWWIARGRVLGWPLTNSTSGGDGVPDLPPETRARMRLVWLGRKHSPEAVEKIRALKRLQRHGPETRAKMSLAHTGRKITWLDKIAEANRKITPDQAIAIRQRLASGETATALAREFGVHRTTLSKIKAGTYFALGQGIKGKGQ